MSEDLVNHDELMAMDDRLRAEAAEWRIEPPADLHERTMRALAGTAAGEEAPVVARIGRVPHGMALAAACLALLITTWAALVLQSPPAAVEPGMEGGSGEMVQAPGGGGSESDRPMDETPATDPLTDLLAAASLESEIAALETDARTISTMMTRQVRLISGQERQ